MAYQMRDGHPIDIHDYEKRLTRAIRFMKAHSKVSQHNKDLIMVFLDRLKAEGRYPPNLSMGGREGFEASTHE